MPTNCHKNTNEPQTWLPLFLWTQARDSGSGNSDCLFTSETRNEVSSMSPSAVHHPARTKVCCLAQERCTDRQLDYQKKWISSKQNLDGRRPQQRCTVAKTDVAVEVKLRRKKHKSSCATYKNANVVFLNIDGSTVSKFDNHLFKFIIKKEHCVPFRRWGAEYSHSIKCQSWSFLPLAIVCFWEDKYFTMSSTTCFMGTENESCHEDQGSKKGINVQRAAVKTDCAERWCAFGLQNNAPTILCDEQKQGTHSSAFIWWELHFTS